MLVLLAWTFLACRLWAADTTGVRRLTVVGPRLSGPVSLSLQNELDAAAVRGRTWLLAQQQSDGGWRTVDATALATLVLLRNATPAEREAVRRGVAWLRAATNDTCRPEHGAAATWRDIALQQAQGPLRAREELIQPPETPLPDETRAPVAALAAAWTNRLSGAAATDPHIGWSLAHAINRDAAGTLVDDAGRVIDWRNELGQRLVACQRMDPAGHGAWWGDPAAGVTTCVLQTAFALLAIDEL